MQKSMKFATKFGKNFFLSLHQNAGRLLCFSEARKGGADIENYHSRYSLPKWDSIHQGRVLLDHRSTPKPPPLDPNTLFYALKLRSFSWAKAATRNAIQALLKQKNVLQVLQIH